MKISLRGSWSVSVKAVLLCALAALVFVGCDRGPKSSTNQGRGAAAVSSDAPHYSNQRTEADEIDVADLPPEAQHVLRLIQTGGSFPYAKDGAVFGNREGMLPAKSRGYYHEYTVPTPGVRDRGARRIISGRTGEYYYTDDHYRSFKRILER